MLAKPSILYTPLWSHVTGILQAITGAVQRVQIV